jgi:hypothetical protein
MDVRTSYIFSVTCYKSNCIGNAKQKVSRVHLMVCPSSSIFRLGILDISYSSIYICTASSGLIFQVYFQNILGTPFYLYPYLFTLFFQYYLSSVYDQLITLCPKKLSKAYLPFPVSTFLLQFLKLCGY